MLKYIQNKLVGKISSYLLLFLLSSFIAPQISSAHAFGQLYNLPVPFWMYLYGGSAAIVFSFIIIGLFINQHTEGIKSKKTPVRVLDVLHTLWFIRVCKTFSMVFFLIIIISGLIGKDNSSSNISMTLFWIFFVIGLGYFIGVFGNIWPVISPMHILSNISSSLFDKRLIPYPKKFGYYPALFFYFLFIWIELYADTTPFTLSIIILIYFFIQCIGLVIFGRKDWLTYGEFFTVFFQLLGKMAIFEKGKNRFYIRVPFSGLIDDTAEKFSLVVFILFMLSSTAFDGFSSTATWEQFYISLYDLFGLFWGEGMYLVLNTIGLFVFLFLFLLLYIAFLWMAKSLTKSKNTLKELVLHFGYSLIPIAFVYNVAHYFTLLITEGQNIYWLLSDPLGYGWNIFGTKGNFDVYIPDVNLIWHTQVGLILVGHIVGVYIAHMLALQLFSNHKKAIISQIPLLILMVIYTMIGLWILSQPITAEM